MSYLINLKKRIPFLFFLLVYVVGCDVLQAQNFTSYPTGNPVDTVSNPQGGICMMGGAGEHDEAMRWFLRRANGGDVLVLRTSGSNGYNKYMYSQLGVKVNSVETIVCNNRDASNDNYIIQKINQAEAIWFAGGDQWDYVSYWRDTPVSRAINKALNNRNIVIGGTSAGMAILGGFYFSAKNGSVSSAEALSNPYRRSMTVDSSFFLDIPLLGNVITDTHYDDPDRKGRHAAFMSRIVQDYQRNPFGIACNAYVAVCVDTDGKAIVYGDYPKYQEFAYFISPDCSVVNNQPEVCETGKPLTWYQDGHALKVYKIAGTNNGLNTFDIKKWKGGAGGEWLDWSIENGTFKEQTGIEPICDPVSASHELADTKLLVYPNPVHDQLHIYHQNTWDEIRIFNSNGQLLLRDPSGNRQVEVMNLPIGLYWLHMISGNKSKIVKFIRM